MICRIVLILGSVLAGQVAAAAGEDLPVQVRRLVRQLNAPQLVEREAAEAELLRLGPTVLDLLPAVTDRTPAEVRQRLGHVRQELQQAAANATARASTITLRTEGMPLSEILKSFREQSGNTILDCRRQFGQPATDPKLSIRFDKTPFLPALDQLLDKAGLTLYPYAQQQALGVAAALGQGKVARVGHASYSGPFRFEPAAIVARRDLRKTDGRSLVLTVEATWEPRLRVVSLMQRMAQVHAVDEHGDPLPVADPDAQPEVPIGGEASGVKLDLPLRLPPREVRQIGSLKGTLLATLLGKIETFRFTKLVDAKNVQQRIAGVTVTVERVSKNGATWEVRVKTRFDDAGDALASHRQWVFSNEAYLEGPDKRPIAYETFETTAQTKNEVGVAYLFRIDRPPTDLSFIYKTPGVIITGGFEYELKGIALP